jgi:hypothetical protein
MEKFEHASDSFLPQIYLGIKWRRGDILKAGEDLEMVSTILINSSEKC